MMQDQRAPKVVVNEDYLDLREDPQKFLANPKRSHNSSNNPHNGSSYLQANGVRYEKELINCGLKKLATSYTANFNKLQKQGSPSKLRVREKTMFEARENRYSSHEERVFKSQSDISFCSSPRKNRDQCSNFHKNSSVIHLYQSEAKTMKPVNKNETKGSKASKKDNHRHHHQRAKSKDYNENKQKAGELNVKKDFEVYHAANYVDPKLTESYCPNQIIEWKRSWTLPVFTPKTQSKQKHMCADNFDRTTYLYDDGTDIDSTFLQSDKNKIRDQEPCTSMVSTLCTMAFEKQFMVLLFIVGSLCGFLLVSLCIWLLFGNELLDILLKPRPREYRITKYFNYVGNGILSIITTIFETIGKVLVMPAQQVYQPWDNPWTRN